jgi:hypothetical protein
MSTAGINFKKDQMEKYFQLHPDSRIISISGSEETFPALFDEAYFSNNKDGGRVEQQKLVPHLTFFSAFAYLLESRVSKVTVNGKEYTVYIVKADRTEETFQAEAFLI